MAWAIYALLSSPGVWDTAADEVRKTVGGRLPGAADLSAVTQVDGVVHETLRLYTPGVISAARGRVTSGFDGHRTRAGRLLLYSPYVTHRLPEL